MSELFYRYANSHLYDIYAALVGTLTFLCMLMVKRPIKRLTARAAAKRAQALPESVEGTEKACREQVYRRRLNMVLPLLTEAIAVGIFFICALCFRQIHFSWGSALLAGIVALAEYAFVEQVV